MEIKNDFQDKIILITGGTGTVGSALAEKILKYHPKQLRIFSRDETKQYYLWENLGRPENVRLFIGDVRDKDRLMTAMENVDIVFHAAAMKHVPFCEYNPFEAIKTNTLGSLNVIDACIKNRVQKVIAISTDKAVNPTNVMGTTKLLMEKLFINANYFKGQAQTIFSCVRFGNVAWARGSVFPLWQMQAEKNQKIKITDPGMTRFLMSQEQTTNLILEAASLALGGEIFILKMPSANLKNIAEIFLAKYFPGQEIAIETIGLRPGEKKHEELLNTQETYKHIFSNDRLIILAPDLEIFGLQMTPKHYAGFEKLPQNLKILSSENSIDLEKIKQII